MSHLDDDQVICDCDEVEAKYNSQGDAVCPHCGKVDKDGEFDLVCGDHGMKCNECGGRFTCP